MKDRYYHSELSQWKPGNIFRKVFWMGLYITILFPIATLAIVPNRFMDVAVAQWFLPVYGAITVLAALLLPLAIIGAVVGVFLDKPGQRWLILGSMFIVTLYAFIAIFENRPHEILPFGMFEVEMPQRIWDFKTTLVYGYQLLYMGLLIGAITVVLRTPQWAAWLMALGLALRIFEVVYTKYVNEYAFLPTHLAQHYESFEDVPLDEWDAHTTAMVNAISLVMGHTLEFVSLAVLIALVAMARNGRRPAKAVEEG